MQHAKLLVKMEQEITRMFHKAGDKLLIYHNIHHTAAVVKRAIEIAAHYHLNEEDSFIITSAAWYHDTGYITGSGEDHEKRSAEMASHFLEINGTNPAVIQKVVNCILATRMPQQPASLLEEIVCDADLYHFGLPDFSDFNKLMRKEQQAVKGKKISKITWTMLTIEMLKQHNFKTTYAKDLLSEGKNKNIALLNERLQTLMKEQEPTISLQTDNTSHAAHDIPAETTDGKKPSRGIETMFRISSNNHQRLSDMADNKANIMITTTSIILSILLSVLLRKLEDNHHLIFPSFLLLAVCLVTMIFSIKATRPSLPEGRFSKQDLDAKKTNLLFFGNFYKMNYEDYHQGIEAMMNSREFLYSSLTLDVYSQGIVLGKKYKLLRFAYNTFMYGVSASVIAFFAAVLLNM